MKEGEEDFSKKENKEEYSKNVVSKEQLKELPACFLSDDPYRPLQNADGDGTIHKYALNPMRYNAIFILLVESLERFSYYGLTFTQYPYLTGEYNKTWSPGFSTVEASSFTR